MRGERARGPVSELVLPYRGASAVIASGFEVSTKMMTFIYILMLNVKLPLDEHLEIRVVLEP